MKLSFCSDPLVRFSLAVVLALLLLWAYNRQKIELDNAALGIENHTGYEIWQGRRITAARPREIEDLVRDLARQSPTGPIQPGHILWLGNSQLHTINQFRSGEHLAPYWLAEFASCGGRGGGMLPLGLSLPNANLQEQLVLTQYVMGRLPVRLVTLKLVFDDLREDGLRGELEPLLTADIRRSLGESQIGREILSVSLGSEKTEGGNGEKNASGLEGFAQRHLEEWLDELLSVFPLWAERGNLRGRVMLDLYDTRNWIFGISPSSVRRMIPAHYSRNMRAFDKIVSIARRAGVPLLVYIAPIRSDAPIPYDATAYRRWIGEIEARAAGEGFAFLNLEGLVPNDEWGTHVADNIDFMHFQGKGHKRLAKALLPLIQRLVGLEQPFNAADEVGRR